MTRINRLMAFAVGAAMVLALPALLSAKKPGSVSTEPELEGTDISVKTNCHGGPHADACKINNLTVTVKNNGGDAPNTRVEFYLSDDEILTTTPDELSSVTDTLMHRVALGTVKAGKFKKRTLGGGHLKQATTSTTGKYVIALFDADDILLETDELNNIVVSDPLP